MYNENDARKIQERIFNVSREPLRKGAWWWWFWLFFFDNPKNPEKPRQLMILWSTKQDKKIACNKKMLVLDHSISQKSAGKRWDGAVAAWYFDGEEMHHNFVLDQTPLILEKNGVLTENPDTGFVKLGNWYKVSIGKDMEFNLKMSERNEFTQPQYKANEYLGGRYNYKIIKMNKLDLAGKVDGEEVTGSAYFQRVFVNAPAVPWYWGVFHFDDGSMLTYMRAYLGVFRKAIRKHISFYHNGILHEFKDIKVKRVGKKQPVFYINGENEKERVSYEVHSYEHSSWTFDKPFLGWTHTLVYNEYPANVRNFRLENKETGEILSQEKLGKAIGNAEHTIGFLP
jgi:hypothetical protein